MPIGAATGGIAGTGMAAAHGPALWPLALVDRPSYGPPMWPGPLAYGPANEMGVVFLFGVLAQQLGFVVHKLQAEFPDCEAMRQIGEEKWQYLRIEFEYESRNFLRHMHDASQCDLIICWKHNWPECPLQVVELKKVFGLQQSGVSQNFLPQIQADGKPTTEARRHGERAKNLPLMNTDDTDQEKPKSLKHRGTEETEEIEDREIETSDIGESETQKSSH